MKLLIVDDEPLIRESVAEVVEDDFETILQASDGIEGFEVVCRELPDLILLDVTMPRLDGLAVCAQLRGAPGLVDVPIVMLTAHRTEDEARAAFAAGASDYMVKPFAIGQLRARLRTLALARAGCPPDSLESTAASS